MENCVTVYAVSAGEYSDYGITCLFTTKKLAQAYIHDQAKLAYAAACDESERIKIQERFIKATKENKSGSWTEQQIPRRIEECQITIEWLKKSEAKAKEMGFDRWISEKYTNDLDRLYIEEFQLWSVSPTNQNQIDFPS